MSNTAMTMLDSVMAWKPKNSSTWIYNPDPDWLDRQSPDEIDTMRMIRADIAEELARALEVAQVWLNYDGRYDMQGINAILTRYRALTP